MNFIGISGALFFALLLTFLFSGPYRRRGAAGGLLLFCLIIFLVAWAAQIWIIPVGPIAFGVSWVPFISVAFLVAVLLIAAAPSAGRVRKETSEPAESPSAPLLAFGMLFWVLLVMLLLAIVAGYYILPGTTVLAV